MILHAVRERVGQVGDESPVVVGAGLEVVDAVVDAVSGRAVGEPHRRGDDELAAATADHGVGGELIREAEARCDQIERVLPHPRPGPLVSVHQLEGAEERLPGDRVRDPGQQRVEHTRIEVAEQVVFLGEHARNLPTQPEVHRQLVAHLPRVLGEVGLVVRPAVGVAGGLVGAAGGNAEQERRKPVAGGAGVGAIEGRRGVGEVERAAGVIVLEVVDFAAQQVGADLDGVVAFDLGQRRRERVGAVVGVEQAGVDGVVVGDPDVRNRLHSGDAAALGDLAVRRLREAELLREVDAQVARLAVVVPAQEPDAGVEHRRRVEGPGVGQHRLRGDEVLGRVRVAVQLPVAIEIDRGVGRFHPGVTADHADVLADVVVAAEVELVVVAADLRVLLEVVVTPRPRDGGVGIDREGQQRAGDRVDPVGRDGVAGELQAVRHRAAVAVVGSGAGVVDAALRPRVIDRHDRPGGLVAEVREVAAAHRHRRDGAAQQNAFLVAVALVAREEEQPVTLDGAAQRAAEVVLFERRLLQPGPLAEERVGVELLVAVELEDAAAEGVGAGARGHVDHAAGEAAELGAGAVGLDAELFDRVGTRRQDDDVAVGRVLHRHAVEERRTLIRRAAANLIVASGEDVLAGQTALGAALRDDRRRQRDEIEHVAAVERKLLHRPAANRRGHRRALRLQQRRLAGHGQRFGDTPEREAHLDARRGLDVDLDTLAHPTLEARQLDFEPVRARHQVHEPGTAVLGTDGFAPFARAHADQHDGGTRNRAALAVSDNPQQRSIKALGHRGSRPQHHSGEQS